MVKARYWLIYAWTLIIMLAVYHFNEAVRSHPLTLLFFLLIVGAPEVYYLAHYSIPYFHWFFYHKKTVVKEARALLLFYLLFLLLGVLCNFVLNNGVFIITIALVLPLASGIIAFIHEFYEFEKRHGFLRGKKTKKKRK